MHLTTKTSAPNVASGAGVQKTTLSNGVRVVTEAIPTVRSVAVGVWIDSGSRDEPETEAGISHFIEHMVFKGTERRRMHHIARRMEAVGGYLNAFTSKEYTCYYARALDEHLDRALDTVCDLVVAPSFPLREMDKEKSVVLEEIKMYNDAPEDALFDAFEASMYRGHALGRAILGVPETVEDFTRSQLLNFVEAHYTPDRIVLAVAGNMRHERVVRLAERALASLLRTPSTPWRTPAPGFSPEQTVIPRPIQQAHLVLGTRGLDVHDGRRSALAVLNTLLGGGMSSRLNQNIREKHGYCYAIYSFMNQYADTGDVGVYVGTDAAKVKRTQRLILRELDKLATTPVSTRALHQAKNQVKGSMLLGLESMSNRMIRLGRQELAYGRAFSLDEMVQELDAVTANEVRALAVTLFDPNQMATVLMEPST